MISKFESQDNEPNTYECKCLDGDDPEYFETFAFCDTHNVWWEHEVASYRSWKQVNPEVVDRLVPEWMRGKVYGKQ